MGMGNPMQEAVQDIALGSLAGGVGKIIEYPFDTVKVRLQSQAAGQPLRYTGPLDCFKQSIATDGVYGGLYRGVSAPTVGAAIETSSLFLSVSHASPHFAPEFLLKHLQYHVAQEALMASIYGASTPLPLSALCLAGAASGAFTSLVLTPIELVKCRVQVYDRGLAANKLGVAAVINLVLKEQGVLGFWRGQLGTLIRETGGSAAWFGSYEGVSAFFRARVTKDSLSSSDPAIPVWQQLIAGATAGMSYNFAFYPADTIKSRMQTEVVPSGTAQQTFWSVGRTLWRDQGLRDGLVMSIDGRMILDRKRNLDPGRG
ncbi:MAG: hypothetical protein Q9162_006162 [Coniocarpon cinnabarinum]